MEPQAGPQPDGCPSRRLISSMFFRGKPGSKGSPCSFPRESCPPPPACLCPRPSTAQRNLGAAWERRCRSVDTVVPGLLQQRLLVLRGCQTERPRRAPWGSEGLPLPAARGGQMKRIRPSGRSQNPRVNTGLSGPAMRFL